MAHRQDVEKAGKMAVLAKADAVVSLLVEAGPLTPGEIADELGEPRSSIYRLLSSLEHLGWVERDSRPHGYRLGLKLIGIGAATVRHLDVRQIALPVMERLHQITGESIFLCVRREWRAVCIEGIEGTGVQSVVLQIGASFSLDTSAVGLALLAFEPVEVWDAFVAARAGVENAGSAPFDAHALFLVLEESVRAGVVVTDGGASGFAGVGVPVLDHRGEVAAALAVSGPCDRVVGPDVDLAATVMAAGAEVSAGLGHLAEHATAS
jgi:DNA-binding IclR family transcriptional regulator